MIQIIQILLESVNSLLRGIDIFLQSKDLTLGAILALVAPFIVLWMKVSNEKGKKAKQLLIERRQMQIAFNVNEIMEALKVESKWSLQEIGSTQMDPLVLKKRVLLSRVATILRRLKKMNKWTSRKFLMAILAAILPIINSEFNLGLDTNVVIAAIGGIVAFILGEAHIDAKRAGGSSDAIAPIDTSSNK